MDLKLIGEQLKVSHILEGSVRKSGNKLRVTAQLISVADGFHLYSEKFDRELDDIFAIQDEISLAILNAIKIKLFGAEKDAVLKRYTDNVEAYQLYLNGRFHVNKFTPDGFFKAIEYFQAAIAIDPDYAIAYSGLSFCYMNLGHQNWSSPDKSLPLAIQFANKSLELDDEIAESHLAVGRVKLHCELKVREAEIEFKKAIAINPNSAEIYIQLSFCAAFLGNNKEAIEYAIKAESLDPFSLLNLYYIGVPYWGVGDFEKNLALGKRLIDLEPYFPGGYAWVGLSYLFSKRYEDAIPTLEMAVKLYPDLQNLSALGGCYGLMGNKKKAMEIIEK
jgi:adenylate cyclase